MGVDIPDATNWTGTYDVYMVIDDLGEVIAERTLKRSVNNEDPTDVIVRLGKPQPFPDDSGFYSPFEVVGLGVRKIRYAAGVDAFQSLQLCCGWFRYCCTITGTSRRSRCSSWSRVM